ncbi:hypothetical protein NCL_04353 [Burkholderia pseudomallei]
MWNCRRGGAARCRAQPGGRAEAARIPRLRFVRRGRLSGPAARAGAQRRSRRGIAARDLGPRVVGLHGYRAHALGDARRARDGQRASAFFVGRRYAGRRYVGRTGGERRRVRRHRAGRRVTRSPRADRAVAQRHHRELRGAARGPRAARLRVREPDRQRGDRASRRSSVRRRPVRRGAARARAAARQLRDRGDVPRRAAPDRRRARRDAARRRHRRRRALPRVGRDRAVEPHRPDRVSRERRRRRYPAAPPLDRRRERAARRADGAHDRRACGGGRSRRLSLLHAKGDLRAAARGRRYAARRHVDHARAVRRSRMARAERGGLGAAARVRRQLSRGAHREILDREHRRPAGERRDRERVPLSRRRAESEGARRRGVAKRRDGRRARRGARGEAARHAEHARDLQRADERARARMRVELHHAGRHRGGRRVDEGVHDAARRAVPVDARARAGARACPTKTRSGICTRCATCPRR